VKGPECRNRAENLMAVSPRGVGETPVLQQRSVVNFPGIPRGSGGRAGVNQHLCIPCVNLLLVH